MKHQGTCHSMECNNDSKKCHSNTRTHVFTSLIYNILEACTHTHTQAAGILHTQTRTITMLSNSDNYCHSSWHMHTNDATKMHFHQLTKAYIGSQNAVSSTPSVWHLHDNQMIQQRFIDASILIAKCHLMSKYTTDDI